MKVGDSVMYDGVSDGLQNSVDGTNQFFIAGFESTSSDKVLIGNVKGGHNGGVTALFSISLVDENGQPLKYETRDGSNTYFWVDIDSLFNLNSIRLKNSQLKMIIS